MNILWKSESWRRIVAKSRDSKPFFFTFAMVCGVIPGIVGYGVMQVTNSRNDKLESHLRKNSRPETRVCSLITIFLCIYMFLCCFLDGFFLFAIYLLYDALMPFSLSVMMVFWKLVAFFLVV